MTGEGSKATIDEELLVSLARELTDTVAEFRSVRNNSSVNINAGGVTAALALAASVLAAVLVCLGAGWIMLKQASMEAEMARTRQDLQDQQTAWVSVMQQRISEAKK